MKLNDKIRGAIVGYAFGDALGLGTEFMTTNEVRFYYPDGLQNFSQIIRDAHRCQWEQGEWSGDTEICTRLIESVLDTGRFDIHEIVKKFKQWYDEEEKDVSAVYRAICEDPEWLAHPISTAHKRWHISGLYEASNESAQRSIVTGLTSQAANLTEDTRKITLITNDDSRCVATTMILAHTMHTLLTEERIPTHDELYALCRQVDRRTLPWLDKAYNEEITSLELDDVDSMAWTRKAMAAALWAMWHCDSAEETFSILIHSGGDANTNAAIGGAIAGLRFGYDGLPEEKLNLVRHDYLIDLADRLSDYRTNL